MSVKRRDNKNRVLRNGESQRKDGRYIYKFKDILGNTRYLYSWKLEKTDRTPAGKKDDLSLREKEKIVKRSVDAGIVFDGGRITMVEMVEKYIASKNNLSQNSRVAYERILGYVKNDSIGSKRIDSIKMSDIKSWVIALNSKRGLGYNTISSVRAVIKPAFQMAVDDDLINKNPFNFKLNSIIDKNENRKDALTDEEEHNFLEYIRNSNRFARHYDGIFLLLKTGMRISELAGLTVGDIDMNKRTISINHQLQGTGARNLTVTETKTDSGNRTLPMTDEVYNCILRLMKSRKNVLNEPVIDGVSGFLFLNRNGNPFPGRQWAGYFNRIVKNYNLENEIKMPNITPHVCRHTYCSNMVKKGINLKTLQYLMGHSNVNITLNVYTHIAFEDIESEVERVSGYDS